MQYSFSDFVAIPDIQQLLIHFQSSSGIETEIIDIDGQFIVSSSRNTWHEFHPEGNGELYSPIKENLSRRVEPISGFFKYARAIRIEDREIGTLFLGPVFHAQPNEDTLHQLAREFDFDETTYLENVKKVPVVTKEQAQWYVEFLVQLSSAWQKKVSTKCA